jgi:hypothetical protein
MADIQTRATIARLIGAMEKQEENITILLTIVGEMAARIDALEDRVDAARPAPQQGVLSDADKASLQAAINGWTKPGAH